jgi:N-acetylmuramoyl-L-alanine amidase
VKIDLVHFCRFSVANGHHRSIGRQRLVGVIGLGAALILLSSCSSSAHAQSAATTTTTTMTAHVAATTTTTTTTTTTPAVATLPAGQPLAGKVVGIDPGHNGLNYTNPGFLDQQVFNGRTMENCDTTGTQTDSGYTEALFNFNVAQYLTSDLEAEGAHVVLTRSTNSGEGPCVDQRAQILNSAKANVAIDIHADGGPSDGRGFAVLEPVADGPNDAVVTSSVAFGSDVLASFEAITGMPLSTYDGTNGISFRNDLAGLNLTTVPKVLIECGNMKNSTDAALLTSTAWQQRAALALASAITDFLR